MTPALTRLVEAAVGRRQQLKLWLSHLASCQPCQGPFFCEAGQEIYRPFRTLNDELDEAADALAAVAQVAPESKGAKMGDCPHGTNDWSTCTYCSQVLQADLTSARAALRLAQILFHGIQCQCEWCQHPAVKAALKETP